MTAPRFFRDAGSFGRWLASHHASESELWVGLYKKHAAHRGMTYPQAVEEALCWGWIDGVMRRMDEDRVMQRFTPRKAKSTWSLVNVAKVAALKKAGRMQPAGLATFKARDPVRTGIYSFEQPTAAFSPGSAKRFRADRKAWKWFAAQTPSYRKAAMHWVEAAKRPDTRARRLQQLIEHSGAGKKLPRFLPLDQQKR